MEVSARLVRLSPRGVLAVRPHPDNRFAFGVYTCGEMIKHIE